MEKIIYTLWKRDNQSGEDFREYLKNDLTPALKPHCVHELRFCVVDSAVAPADPYRMESSKPVPDAIISLWVNSSVFRADLEKIIDEHVPRFAGYLVTESEPLVNTAFPARPGQRTHGMNEVVMLQKPDRLSYEEWIDIWHGSHTQIAIDTQSTFGYRQNVVTRALTKDAPPCDAIIEENFPEAAIHGRDAFYDAQGNPALKEAREKEMIDSCVRFIDFDKIDCIPMSEYLVS